MLADIAPNIFICEVKYLCHWCGIDVFYRLVYLFKVINYPIVFAVYTFYMRSIYILNSILCLWYWLTFNIFIFKKTFGQFRFWKVLNWEPKNENNKTNIIVQFSYFWMIKIVSTFQKNGMSVFVSHFPHFSNIANAYFILIHTLKWWIVASLQRSLQHEIDLTSSDLKIPSIPKSPL